MTLRISAMDPITVPLKGEDLIEVSVAQGSGHVTRKARISDLPKGGGTGGPTPFRYVIDQVAELDSTGQMIVRIPLIDEYLGQMTGLSGQQVKSGFLDFALTTTYTDDYGSSYISVAHMKLVWDPYGWSWRVLPGAFVSTDYSFKQLSDGSHNLGSESLYTAMNWYFGESGSPLVPVMIEIDGSFDASNTFDLVVYLGAPGASSYVMQNVEVLGYVDAVLGLYGAA